jgi:hypothetical protein
MTASIVFQATAVVAGTIGGGGAYEFNLTVASAAGQERLVVVGGIGNSNNADFDMVTVDGQDATRVGVVSRGDGSNDAFLTFYRAPGTSGTDISIIATNAATGGFIFGGYCSLWSLVDVGSFLDVTIAGVNDPTLDIDTATDGIAVAAVVGFNTSGTGEAAWTGLTEDWDGPAIFGDEVWSGASAITTAETPRAVSVDTTPNPSDSCAAICVSFNPIIVDVTLTAEGVIFEEVGHAAVFRTTTPAAVASFALTGQTVNLGGPGGDLRRRVAIGGSYKATPAVESFAIAEELAMSGSRSPVIT